MKKETFSVRTGQKEAVVDLTGRCHDFAAGKGDGLSTFSYRTPPRESRSSKPAPAATTTCSWRCTICFRRTTADGISAVHRGTGAAM